VAQAQVTVLGVYSPKRSSAEYEAFLDKHVAASNPANFSCETKAFLRRLGRTEDDLLPLPEDELEEIREELDDVLSEAVLVEVLVEGALDAFDVGKFQQRRKGLPSGSWKVAYGEKYLSADGRRLIGDDRPSKVPHRLAFYVHTWSHECGLHGPYGPLTLPPLKPLPSRLWRLVPYQHKLWS
jgi:hypothetical protein